VRTTNKVNFDRHSHYSSDRIHCRLCHPCLRRPTGDDCPLSSPRRHFHCHWHHWIYRVMVSRLAYERDEWKDSMSHGLTRRSLASSFSGASPFSCAESALEWFDAWSSPFSCSFDSDRDERRFERLLFFSLGDFDFDRRRLLLELPCDRFFSCSPVESFELLRSRERLESRERVSLPPPPMNVRHTRSCASSCVRDYFHGSSHLA
jgi:hypothetical protein